MSWIYQKPIAMILMVFWKDSSLERLKVALGDLKHDTIGKHSVYMPIGIGYIASYTLSQFHSNEIEIRIHNDSNKLVEEISN